MKAIPEEHIYDQLWVGLTDTDRVARYYDMIADKMSFRHAVSSVFLITVACGAAVPLLTHLPNYVAAVMFVLASVWTLFANYPAQAMAARLFSDQYKRLSVEWRRLWYGQPTQ